MKKIIFIMAMAICAIALVTSGVKIYEHAMEAREQSQKFDDVLNMLEKSGKKGEKENSTEELDTTKVPKMSELWTLRKKNSDLVGWINIANTRINYPVMQTKENRDYYINHNFEKEKSSYGVPYVDDKSNLDLPSDNIVIYGHHMNNGSMFTDIDRYNDKKFFESNRKVIFNTVNGENEYQIIAVFRATVDTGTHKDFNFYRFTDAQIPDEFENYVNTCKGKSLYDTGVGASYGDKLLTLVTCEYSQQNGRIVLLAKKV
ncbi:MAG: class B sortase [Clostridioides sp.]|jgi:sortase B|nr:class B sortase [Clostridioides sp.]